jgi:hypothetical protein
MISFALAQELKNAGFNPKTNSNAVYFINDHLKIRREDALRMWYGDKSRVGWTSIYQKKWYILRP